MSFLQRVGIASSRTEGTALEQRVSSLQAALAKCKNAVVRGRHMHRELMAAVGLLMFTFGLLVGLYHPQIERGLRGLWGRNPDAGYAAYRKGKYGTAVELLRPLAESGDVRAESTLGLIYYRGGRGVPRDDAKAVKWFRLAAKRSDAIAEFNLGVMYAEGQGVPQDNAEAVKWYRQAAEQGNAPAEYNLGLWYAQGRGGSPDYIRAHMWFNLAASRFPESDVLDRSAAVNDRDVVASKMTPDQIAEAQKRAVEWKPK